MRAKLTGAVAALVAWAAGAGGAEIALTLLHTTDLHGQVGGLVRDPDHPEAQGSLLRVATLVARARAGATNVVLVDCGDTFQGAPESHRTRGRLPLEAMRHLRYDAWLIGNHEFDWGLPALQALVRDAPCPVLGANLAPLPGRASPLPGVRPFVLLRVAGLRIAVVGVTTPAIPSWSPAEDRGELEVRRTLPALREVLPAVRSADPDIRVLLLHQGWRDAPDDAANELDATLREVREFDVALGGHTHQAVASRLIHGTLFAQAGSRGGWLGRVDLVYDTGLRRVVRRTSTLLPADDSVPEDPALAALAGPELDATRRALDEVVGEAADEVVAAADVPGGPPAGRLLRAVLLEASGAEVALHGALSPAGLAPGPIRERDLWALVPYENRVAVAHLDAADLRAVLEEVLGQADARGSPGVSGLEIVVDRSAAPGSRVRAIRRSDGGVLHPRRRVRVAFSTYALASGGMRYPRLREIARRPESRLEVLDLEVRDAVRAWLSAHRPVRAADLPGDGFVASPR